MLPCYKSCAYRAEIVGDCHSRCTFNWLKAGLTMPTNQSKNPARTAQWFIFPLNFDPTWGPDECAGYATERNPELVAPSTPLQDLVSLMGKRIF